MNDKGKKLFVRVIIEIFNMSEMVYQILIFLNLGTIH